MKKNKFLNVSIALNVVLALLLVILIIKFKNVLFESEEKVNENISIVMFGDSITDEGSWGGNYLVEMM